MALAADKKKKRSYDWSSFLSSNGDDDNEDEEIGASSLSRPPKTKKKKAILAIRGMEWMEQQVPVSEQLSLMEKSAEVLAKTYSDNDTLLAELSNMDKR